MSKADKKAKYMEEAEAILDQCTVHYVMSLRVEKARVLAELAKVYAMDELTKTIQRAVENGALQVRKMF